jgi:chitinase
MTSRRIGFAIAIAIAIVTAVVSAAVVASPPERAVIIAYIFPQDDVIDPAQIAAGKLTHINYAFANIRDGKVVEGFAKDAENFKVLAGLRRKHPDLRILVSVGGWTWSGAFSDVALTPESRRRFVTSAVDFVRRHDLDGFDVDWEYPGLPGNGNTHRPEDKENFTALMADLRHALDQAARTAAKGRARSRPYLLTFAAGASPKFLEHTEMAKVQESVDFVNLMTYDFREAGGDPLAGHHANLYPHPADNKQRSVDGSVRDFLAAGVPPNKLVVGVPFYGRAWGDVKPDANGSGLYQPGGKPTQRIETKYGSLSENLVGRNGFVRMWDSTAQGPYLWNADKRIFIGYDDPQSLALKCQYIRDNHLAGAMFWEYYNDPKGTLLDALFRGLHRTK